MCSTIIPYDCSNTSPFAPGIRILRTKRSRSKSFNCVSPYVSPVAQMSFPWLLYDFHGFPLFARKHMHSRCTTKTKEHSMESRRETTLSLSLSKFSNLTWKCAHKCNCPEIHDIATRIVTKSLRRFTGRGPKVHDKYNKSRRVSKRII